MIEYDEKLAIESMLDRLMIFKMIHDLEGSSAFSGNERFYETIRSDYMNFEDGLYNLSLFFEHGNIGDLILEPEFLQIELGLQEGTYDGCLFIFHLKDLQNLNDLQAPVELIESYKEKIQMALELNNDVEWFETQTENVLEFVGVTYVMCIHWHETVEELIKIIVEIRRDCKKYENRCDDK